MSQNTETLLTVAADLRVVGYSWPRSPARSTAGRIPFRNG